MPRGSIFRFITKCFCKSSLGLHVCLIRNAVLQKPYFALPKPFQLFIHEDLPFDLERLLSSPVSSLFPLQFLREQCRTLGKVCVKPFTFFLDDILQKSNWSCCASQAVFSTGKSTLGRLLRYTRVTVEHTVHSKSGGHVHLTPMGSF